MDELKRRAQVRAASDTGPHSETGALAQCAVGGGLGLGVRVADGVGGWSASLTNGGQMMSHTGSLVDLSCAVSVSITGHHLPPVLPLLQASEDDTKRLSELRCTIAKENAQVCKLREQCGNLETRAKELQNKIDNAGEARKD